MAWRTHCTAKSVIHLVQILLLSHQKVTLARKPDASRFAAIILTLVFTAGLIHGKQKSLALHIYD